MVPEPLDEAEVARLAYQRELAQGYREAARRAITLARRYRAEEGVGGERENACIMQARLWRQAIRELRRPLAERPGVARARMGSNPDSDRKTG